MLVLRPHRKAAQKWVTQLRAHLQAAIRAFVDARNNNPTPFRWVKAAEEILANVARFCATTLGESPDIGVRTRDPTH